MSAPTIPTAGPHGGDGARLADALGVNPDDILDLSVSLNPFVPDIAPLLAEHAGTVRRYPDPDPATAALAACIGIDVERVVLTNGGAEAIALVAAERPVGYVDPPDFSLYARHLARLDPAGPRWRSNPHNPTGALASDSEHADVWDEAFYALATGQWTRNDPDAIVVGSLTKLFACPGLRLGYILAPDQAFADAVRRRQPRWSVGSLACAALPALLATAELTRWVVALTEARGELVALLHTRGIHTEPSDASYVPATAAPGLRTHLARRHVLVRDTTSFGIPDGVRIAVPAPVGLEQLRRALEGWNP